YLLVGKNAVELDERLGELRATLDPSGLSTSVIDVQMSSIEELRAACLAAPFFGASRLVILRNPIAQAKRAAAEDAEPADDGAASGRVPWAELSDTLTGLPESTQLIVRHDGALADGHFLVKFAKKHGWTVLRFDLSSNHTLV